MVGFLELLVRGLPRTECGQGVRGADSSLAIRSHRLSVRGADRASGWFCPIREVGEVPWTWCGMPVVRGADRFSGLGHPRVSVRAADRLSGWFSQTAVERVAVDMVLHAGCPRGGIGERWMAAFF